jgi:hypothetical protein
MINQIGVQHKTVTNEEMRKFLGVPLKKPVTLGYFSITYIYPDKWMIKWIEQKENV